MIGVRMGQQDRRYVFRVYSCTPEIVEQFAGLRPKIDTTSCVKKDQLFTFLQNQYVKSNIHRTWIKKIVLEYIINIIRINTRSKDRLYRLKQCMSVCYR